MEIAPKTFAPSVIIDGDSYTPPGWMWVLGFALGGVEWALRESDTQEFRETVRAWTAKQKCLKLERQIAHYEQCLTKLRQELRIEQL